MRSVAALLLLTAGAHSLSAQVSNPGKQPIFFYLFSRYSDFYNLENTESRIHDTLSAVEKLHQKYPAVHASATLLFSGALSQALAERKPDLKNLLVDAARRGIVDLGYDGTDEPTYAFRPLASPTPRMPAEARWQARGDSAEQFLTEARDPATGQVVKGKSGGLKAMQEVFGPAACIKGLNVGLGGDSEYVNQLRRWNNSALLWGLPDPNPTLNIHGYRGSVWQFGLAMAPLPSSSPELNWVDNYLRLSETSDAAIRVVSAADGPEAIKKVIADADRSHVRIIHVELSNERIYLSQFYQGDALYPPIKVAFAHPDHPALPPEALATEKERDDKLASQEILLNWIAATFVASNPGSRFVSSADLTRMSPSDGSRTVSVADLQRDLAGVLKTWADNTYPPDYFTAGNAYLSLADAFQVLCDILAEQHRTGGRPQTVAVRAAFGPLEIVDNHGPATGSVTPSAVAQAASLLAPRFDNAKWQPLPANRVPEWVDVGTLHLTAGQFLRLMAESVVAVDPATPIKVKMTYNISSSGMGYPKQRLPIDQGGTWTFKPAPLRLPLETSARR